jgi:hypothetical protein
MSHGTCSPLLDLHELFLDFVVHFSEELDNLFMFLQFGELLMKKDGDLIVARLHGK